VVAELDANRPAQDLVVPPYLAVLYLSARAGVLIAVVAGIAALAGAVHLNYGRRRPLATRYSWIAVAALLGVVCGSAATAARLGVRDAAPLAELVRSGASVTVKLVVRDDPRDVAGAAGRPDGRRCCCSPPSCPGCAGRTSDGSRRRPGSSY
jgi:hypothetical protein